MDSKNTRKMKKELQDKLKEKYAVFYPEIDPSKRYNEPFSDRGYEIDDGWYDIVDEILSFILFHVENNNYPKIIITQIKEKFGHLSFYFDVVKFEDMKWREWEIKKTQQEKMEMYLKGKYEIRGAISFASTYAKNICEHCGNNNATRVKGDWIKYECANCQKENEKNR